MIQNVVGYATGIINISFVGGLGAQTLSAFALAMSIYNVCGLSVALGLSTGMDTLAGSVRAADALKQASTHS
jgi:Na+-driven multidrug efflux pump